MKSFAAIIFLLLVSQIGYSQSMEIKNDKGYSYTNVIKLSPFELARAEFQISYERYFKDRSQSVFIAPSIILSSQGAEEKEGFQLFLQYRFYLSHLNNQDNYTLGMFNIGFYSAPYLIGLNYSETFEQGVYDPNTGNSEFLLVNEKINAIEGGALMGVQFDITQRIVLDFFIGGGIRKSNVDSNNAEYTNEGFGLLELGYTGVKPRIGLQIGMTF